MATNLCEKCFPYDGQEVYSNAGMFCDVCGQIDDRHNGGARVLSYPKDPRPGAKIMKESGKLVDLPLTGFAPSNADIAKHLREQADWMEEAGARGLRTVVLVLEYEDGDIRRQSCGKRLDLARKAGLLFMAATQAVIQDKSE